MLYQKYAHNMTAFRESNFHCKGKWKELKIVSEHKTARLRKCFSVIRKMFIKGCAKKGLLDSVLTPQQIQQAHQGILPEEYDVHHILPISFGGKNRVGNLCITHKMVHLALHQRFWDIIRENWDTKKYPQAYAFLPVDLTVISDQDITLFFSKTEAFKIKKEYKRRLKIAAFRAKQKELKEAILKQKKTTNHRKRVSEKILNAKYRHRKAMMQKQIEKKKNQEKKAQKIKTYKDKLKYRTSLLKKSRAYLRTIE